jgi:hypothetical protein
MWEPQHLPTLWASTACYRDTFTFCFKLDDESSVAVASSGRSTQSTVSVSSETAMRQYNEDYLSFGFISSGEEQPRPKCIVCSDKLVNETVVLSKLKRNLHTKHSHLCKKPIDYFKRLIPDQTCQAKQWAKIRTIADKAREANHTVAAIMTIKMNSHEISASVTSLACCKIVNMFCNDMKKRF